MTGSMPATAGCIVLLCSEPRLSAEKQGVCRSALYRGDSAGLIRLAAEAFDAAGGFAASVEAHGPSDCTRLQPMHAAVALFTQGRTLNRRPFFLADLALCLAAGCSFSCNTVTCPRSFSLVRLSILY